MKEQLSLLIELQKAEIEIGKINIKCRTLPEEIDRLENNFQEFCGGIEENRKQFEDLQKGHREKEEKLKRGQEALKRARDRLGEVKTNKEYQAILKEIEGIEIKNSEIEDEIISSLDRLDAMREEVKITEKEMDEYRRRYNLEKEKLETEADSMDAALSVHRKTSEELKKRVAGHLLKKYEAIKTLNNGIAVVPTWKEICGGCHMKIPAQLYNEVQKYTDLYVCPNCNRIIYWYDQNGNQS